MNSRLLARIVTIVAVYVAVLAALILLEGAVLTSASSLSPSITDSDDTDGPALLNPSPTGAGEIPQGSGSSFTGPLIGTVHSPSFSGPLVGSVTRQPNTRQPTATITPRGPRQASPTAPAQSGGASRYLRSGTPTPKVCGVDNEDPVPYFNPDDCRADPRPGDRVVVYCEWVYREVDVFGVTNQGQGFRLHTFDFDELVEAGPKGLTQDLGANGIVTLVVNTNNVFSVAWRGGPYGATGTGDFAKTFFCNFNRTPPPSTTPRPRPIIVVPVYTVTPTRTFTPDASR